MTAPSAAPVSGAGARFRYRNPLDLPRIEYADIVNGAADGVYVEPPGTPRVFRRAPPAFHDDPDGAGLFPSLPEATVVVPPVFTASLRNVTLAGFRSLLSPEGYFTNDLGHLNDVAARDFARGLAHSNEIDPLAPVDGEDVYALVAGDRRQERLDGPVVLLTSAEPGNFGSFLYHDIVKLLNLVEVPANWRFLSHAPERTYQDFLELVGLPPERVVQHDIATIYHIDQAIVPGVRTPYACADPGMSAFYDRLREKCDAGVRGRRIYVSRRSVSACRPGGRVMANEAELIERLEQTGFDIVEPQRLSARDQVATFGSADLVVGPSGAGMFNAVFCRPGVKLIDIESEPHWIKTHINLFASAGLEYGVFESLAADRDWSVHHKSWSVNIEALMGRIEAFASPSGDPEGASPTGSPAPLRGPLWSTREHAGEDYTHLLQRIHQGLQPKVYLEIGVADGTSLALAQCSALAIDPNFQMTKPVLAGKPCCHFYQMTSDQFFEEHDAKAILGGPVDLAFLDGMHWFEFLLRDFINTESQCHKDAVIVLHDCMPTDEYVGRRNENDQRQLGGTTHAGWWAGDVWKTLAILLKARPDLQILAFDAPPTGLVAVTRLSPESTVLREKYLQLVKEYSTKTLAECGDELYATLNIIDAKEYADSASLAALLRS